jgi:hypothetical protein
MPDNPTIQEEIYFSKFVRLDPAIVYSSTLGF